MALSIRRPRIHLYLLDKDHRLIQAIPYPYGMIERGVERWYTLKISAIKVPTKFVVALSFNPHRTKGIYLGLDESVKHSHSLQGRPTQRYRPVTRQFDWMIRAVLAPAVPTENPFENLLLPNSISLVTEYRTYVDDESRGDPRFTRADITANHHHAF